MDIIVTISAKTEEKYFVSQIKQCKENGVLHLRFNLGKLSKKDGTMFLHRCQMIREMYPGAQIIFDLPFPGGKPRMFLSGPTLQIMEGDIISFNNQQLEGNHINVDDLSLYYKKNKVYYYEDGVGALKVKCVEKSKVVFVSINTFAMYSGKALPCEKICGSQLPQEIIDMINKISPEQIWLSFVENAECEQKLFSHLKYTPSVFLKIESEKGVRNIDKILAHSCANIVVARGDLGRSTTCNLLSAQDHLRRSSQKYNRKIYLATDFLKSMRYVDYPSRADMIDLQLAIHMRVNGIMLNVSNLSNNFEKQIQYIRLCEIHTFDGNKY